MHRIAFALATLLGALQASAAPTPDHVKPFVDDEGDLFAVTGAFGAKGTTLVIWWDIMGAGSYKGFGLVPDAKAKHGYKKLALPLLPLTNGVTNGGIRTVYVGNLDKDADDEIVIELKVTKAFGGPHGGGTYSGYDYLVLDGNGKELVRMTAVEDKLRKARDARDAT
jgi:hypothetical protein